MGVPSFQKAFIPMKICKAFKGTNIWPLNLVAMECKM